MLPEDQKVWDGMVEAATGNFLPTCQAVVAVDYELDEMRRRFQKLLELDPALADRIATAVAEEASLSSGESDD